MGIPKMGVPSKLGPLWAQIDGKKRILADTPQTAVRARVCVCARVYIYNILHGGLWVQVLTSRHINVRLD